MQGHKDFIRFFSPYLWSGALHLGLWAMLMWGMGPCSFSCIPVAPAPFVAKTLLCQNHYSLVSVCCSLSNYRFLFFFFFSNFWCSLVISSHFWKKGQGDLGWLLTFGKEALGDGMSGLPGFPLSCPIWLQLVLPSEWGRRLHLLTSLFLFRACVQVAGGDLRPVEPQVLRFSIFQPRVLLPFLWPHSVALRSPG